MLSGSRAAGRRKDPASEESVTDSVGSLLPSKADARRHTKPGKGCHEPEKLHEHPHGSGEELLTAKASCPLLYSAQSDSKGGDYQPPASLTPGIRDVSGRDLDRQVVGRRRQPTSLS